MRQNDALLFNGNRSKELSVSNGNFTDGVVKQYRHLYMNDEDIICLNNVCSPRDTASQSNSYAVKRFAMRNAPSSTRGKWLSTPSSNSLTAIPRFSNTMSLSITGYKSESLECKHDFADVSSKSSSDVLRKGISGVPQSTSARSSFKMAPSRWKTRPSGSTTSYGYPDPLTGATKTYLQRISEMASHENETIKFEKMKRAKKKKDVSWY